MALEDLIAKINHEAEEQAAGIGKEADEEAEALKTKRRAEIGKEAEQIAHRGDSAADSERGRILSLASLEARKRVLAARQEAIGQVIDEALKRIRSLPAEEYFALLEKGILSIDDIEGEQELILSQEDKNRLPSDFLDRVNPRLREDCNISLSEETREIGGGFILRKGKMEENFSLVALLQEMRNDLEIEIAKALFGE